MYPKQNALVAAASVLLMWLAYYLGSQASGYSETAIFTLLVMLGVGTVFPLWYVRKYEGGKLSNLGLHASWIKRSIAVSLFLGAGSLFYYFQLADINDSQSLWLLVWSLLMFWEVFFVFGWLQIRFDRAFGTITGVVLTSFAFTIYHFGSVPAEQLIGIAISGLFFAIIFKIFRMNIFVLWPFAWGVGIAISTAQSGSIQAIDWQQAATALAVLALQFMLIRSLYLKASKQS